jgi:hypothetical protein
VSKEIWISNLLSGFIGAIAAVMMPELIRIVNTQFDRRKKSRILLEYIRRTIIPGLEKYISDADIAIEAIGKHLTRPNLEINTTYDLLPSLNSAILKEIGFNDLYFLCQDYEVHYKIIDLYHCIDYLKEFTPIDAQDEFTSKCENHMKEKGIENEFQLISHVVGGCVSIKDYRKHAISNITLRKENALENLQNVAQIIKKLG